MNYIYNKQITNTIPQIKFESDFKVTIKDILLTFASSECRGKSIYIQYYISYFNIPQNVKEYEIEKHIDYVSLRKAVLETVGDLGEFFSLDELNSRKAIIKFDAEKFLNKANFPVNVKGRPALNQVVLSLHLKVPTLVVQTTPDYTILFSELMTSIIRNNSKYNNIFKYFKSWKYSKHPLINAEYDSVSNSFIVTLKDPVKRMIYYYI